MHATRETYGTDRVVMHQAFGVAASKAFVLTSKPRYLKGHFLHLLPRL